MNWDKGIEGIEDQVSRLQIETLDKNIKEFGAKVYFPFLDKRQGIVHVIGPETGFTQPGITLTCGDSHTSTHGAMGAYAFGVGATNLKQVLATQCLLQRKPETFEVRVEGRLGAGVSAKDIILALIAHIGVGGGTGHVIEYTGPAIHVGACTPLVMLRTGI